MVLFTEWKFCCNNNFKRVKPSAFERQFKQMQKSSHLFNSSYNNIIIRQKIKVDVQFTHLHKSGVVTLKLRNELFSVQ